MKSIDDRLLDELSAAARHNPRLRQNYNFHESFEEPCQCLVNAIESGSYVRPHRRLDLPRPETFIVVRGRVAAFVFRDDGTIGCIVPLAVSGPARGIDIPPGPGIRCFPWRTVRSSLRPSLIII